MPSPSPCVHYDGMEIEYAAISVSDDRVLTLLDIAQREDLLEHWGSTQDGHYAILCNGQRLLIAADEAPGFVVSLFVAAGKDIAPIAYRTGLRRSG